MEITEVAKTIFNSPPRSKNEIDIGLDESSDDLGDDDPHKIVFEIFLQILLKGKHILFPDIDIDKLSLENLVLLNQYMESMGVSLLFEAVLQNNKIVNIDTNILDEEFRQTIKGYRLHFESVYPRQYDISHFFVKFEEKVDSSI